MKRARLLGFLSICTGFLAFGFPRNEKAPPGTVRANDTLFVDRTEIANAHWREFTFWHQQYGDSTSLAAILPDSCWVPLAGNGPGDVYSCSMGEVYFRHPRFSFYPVLGLTHAQAEAFCRWRSDRVNELIARQPERWPFRKVHYRLPTEAEWMALAEGGLDTARYPFGVKNTTTKKGFNLVNWGSDLRWKDPGAAYPVEVPTWPVNAGAAGIGGSRGWIGNVAEMLAAEGIAKGGYYALPPDSCRIGARQYYDGPKPWLGFRCVATVE
ncbi:formylglycine-generating enzyme family protein [Flaviaesturariibacter aridisoli]|uniref:Sulfatase-modifying factor enzyme-like domain-containing protein n=1 Tax=Flaviaesturariibacter aridisoli TaxID=2545761 RepID=A0A4R4E0T7_9BACT|nr:SUMF1/EgtB/PvdO family nonheme iron enzyme [Flaviaesturariibacter aridisoli]TCZ67874.1 hypothetical protein E0486_15025 [Flaviaesturariibacter aridisoli]